MKNKFSYLLKYFAPSPFVIDTMLSAKLRAIEPVILDKSDKPEVGVLLPGTLASYSTYDLDFALDYRTIIGSYAAEMPVIALGTT